MWACLWDTSLYVWPRKRCGKKNPGNRAKTERTSSVSQSRWESQRLRISSQLLNYGNGILSICKVFNGYAKNTKKKKKTSMHLILVICILFKNMLHRKLSPIEQPETIAGINYHTMSGVTVSWSLADWLCLVIADKRAVKLLGKTGCSCQKAWLRRNGPFPKKPLHMIGTQLLITGEGCVVSPHLVPCVGSSSWCY